jgi:hypothetical protein
MLVWERGLLSLATFSRLELLNVGSDSIVLISRSRASAVEPAAHRLCGDRDPAFGLERQDPRAQHQRVRHHPYARGDALSRASSDRPRVGSRTVERKGEMSRPCS